MRSPLAYFLTWTTQATWLHGDERGSIDRTHATLGLAKSEPDGQRERHEGSRVMTVGVVLGDSQRALVAEIIAEHCEFRGWRLLACNVRTNHVHVVVGKCGTTAPETVMSQLKAWATRRLREAGFIAADARVWTEHGSTRWIIDEDSLSRAIDYVADGQ